MHVFNPVFYDEYNLMNYLDFAVMKTAKLYPDVLREEIYLLFYLIKDNFQANMKYLRENNVDVDCFGFLPVRRNTRNSVEAFFDMFNLINAENYISVLLYMNDKKNNRYDDLYKKYAFKGDFTIISKRDIAKDHGLGRITDDEKMAKIDQVESGSNSYIHPSIFIRLRILRQRRRSCVICSGSIPGC